MKYLDYQYYAKLQAKANYFNITQEEAKGIIPLDWIIFEKRHGFIHPLMQQNYDNIQESLKH